MSDNSALLARIAELEAQLAQTTIQETVDAKAADAAARTGGSRATEGTAKTISSKGKIGGEFQVTANPAFLAERLSIFEKLKANYKGRVEALPHEPITVTMPDGKVWAGEAISWKTTPMDIAKSISNSLAKNCVVADVRYTGTRYAMGEKVTNAEEELVEAEADVKVQGELWDLNRPLEGDCELHLIKFGDEEGRGAAVFFHSAAHVLGQALERTLGGQLTVGPALKEGFYYDCYMGQDTITEDKTYGPLQKCISAVVKDKQEFERIVITKEEAAELFAYNPFKMEIINTKIPDGAATTVYRNGPFIDLCMGPHIPSTALIKTMKVFRHSAAYWMGDADNDSLQRVYGIAFPDKKLMALWEKKMKRQAELDHRRIGADNKLFMFHELSPGSCFFMPHGTRIYNTLVDFIKHQYVHRGYTEVISPNIYHTDLWRISGHYQHYKDDMFLFNTNDREEYALKPMNCPGHCLLFRHALRSWRELPIRMADFGVLHRNELKGALGGLTRVRRFQQDDAHIFCRQSQIQDEVLGALDFMRHVYGVFGMTYKLERSTRPKKAVGLETPDGVQRWDDAEAALAAALDKFAGPGNWKDNPGDGAFYGPKIDIKVFDCMERMHQCATIQLDFNLPIRFNLKYKSPDEQVHAHIEGTDGAAAAALEAAASEKAAHEHEKAPHLFKELPNGNPVADKGYDRPVMVHRAMLGSVERMIAILTEHFGGKWPLWLSPRQVMVIPLHESCNEYAQSVADKFVAAGLYADAELGSKKFKRKIAEAQQIAYNYMLCVGPKDMEAGTTGLRRRGETVDTRGHKVDDVLQQLLEEVRTKALPKDLGNEDVAAEKAAGGAKKAQNKKKGKAVKKEIVQPEFSKMEVKVGQIIKVCACTFPCV
eukprot:INCI12160.1.p1 GENE.INCI12160.1~~INCI12160.1.p1  ORF type:complete len:881 (+),score=184.65 INCI12160.1:140-2782(+)